MITRPTAVCLFTVAFLASFILIPKKNIVDLFGLRIEDIFGVLAILYCFFLRRSWHSNAIFLSYLTYLLYAGVHALTSSSFLLPSFVILAKYLSYISFYYLFHEFASTGQLSKNSERVLVVCLVWPAVYGLYQVVSVNYTGEYGVSFPGHAHSPLSSAAMYFFCAVLIDVLLEKRWRFLYLTFISLSLLGGSKTVFLMVVIYVILTTRTRLLIPVVLLSSLLLYAVIQLGPEAHSLHRYSGFLDPINSLAERGIWHKLPNYRVEPHTLFFGKGIEYGHVQDGQFNYGMAFDNMYLYLISTDGLVGSFLFFIFVTLVVYSTGTLKASDRRTVIALLLGLLAGGLGAETFFLSVPALTFWIVLGILRGKTLREASQKF